MHKIFHNRLLFICNYNSYIELMFVLEMLVAISNIWTPSDQALHIAGPAESDDRGIVVPGHADLAARGHVAEAIRVFIGRCGLG